MSMHKWNTLAARSGFSAAMIVAGALAMTGAVELHHHRTLQVSEQDDTPVEPEALGPVALTVMPKMSAYAVPNLGEATPPTRVQKVAETEPPNQCHPAWRPLETGPLGRMVIQTCPGWRGTLPAEPPARVDPTHDKLPTIADFVQPVVEHSLEDTAAAPPRADLKVAKSLESDAERTGHPLAPASMPPAPYFGALDWAPSVRANS